MEASKEALCELVRHQWYLVAGYLGGTRKCKVCGSEKKLYPKEKRPQGPWDHHREGSRGWFFPDTKEYRDHG